MPLYEYYSTGSSSRERNYSVPNATHFSKHSYLLGQWLSSHSARFTIKNTANCLIRFATYLYHFHFRDYWRFPSPQHRDWTGSFSSSPCTLTWCLRCFLGKGSFSWLRSRTFWRKGCPRTGCRRRSWSQYCPTFCAWFSFWASGKRRSPDIAPAHAQSYQLAFRKRSPSASLPLSWCP